ncbi:chemotaxis protein CheA [Deefgea sp. CFH1-16]|uniref:chemotaxis protein CheA n=1 Tax=Deefgea sp. CFH1-16 TaxID=2675457 RepID=UPI0015F4A575|nr:chemotaxis protein CheA [Deefgea sp. CFH1-16]MBM5573997.1 chemotaxis protein CheA [Deefgea sp. CFH1-16]
MDDEGLQGFIDEANQLLQQMEHILLDAENAQGNMDLLNALFRTMHTIKGSAGLFALDNVIQFTHEVENVLDLLRKGSIQLDETLVSVMLGCRDYVQSMVDTLSNAAIIPSPDDRAVLLADLQQYQVKKTLATSSVQAKALEVAPPLQVETSPSWLIFLGFGPDLLRHGLDPASFLRFLARQGRIERVLSLIDTQLNASDFDPEHNYLQFAVRFAGDTTAAALHDVFEFVREDSLILIAPLAEAHDFLQLQTGQIPDDVWEQINAAWVELGLAPLEAENLAPNVSSSMSRLAQDASAELGGGKKVKTEKTGETVFLRVEAEKLDSLINLVGELVISGAAGNLLAKQNGAMALQEWSLSMSNLIEQIRAGVLSMRMAQIGEVFQRFPRVVRDVAKELGKDIHLEVTGAETELDKSMIEKLSDPLMHIVRNAMDHGIESKEARIKAGKPIHGTVYLNAYHESGSVMIEVSDDGAGLRRDKIFAKALECGLVSADAQLSDQEIFSLIFEPGFSTADQVTNLSGRGVGMDVVKKSIDALRGHVMVDSDIGVGTVIRIRLPLTLAIIDGFLVRSSNATYVVPLESVIECIELPDELKIDGSLDHLNLRGELLPLLRLSHFLELESSDQEIERANVVVIRANERKVGLVVDALLGEFQTVIKPLGALFQHLKAIGGSTILGNGQVALILDVNELVQHVTLRDAEIFSFNHELATRSAIHNHNHLAF